MRRRLLVAAMALLLLLSVVAVVQAEKGGNSANRFCRMFDDFGLSHGECVSFFRAGVPAFCKFWVEDAACNSRLGPFRNVGQCVSFIRSFG